MGKALGDYFAALERLRHRKPLRIAPGTRISNDAVAREAGRGKGSIKKSRAGFAELIEAIDAAAAEQTEPVYRERERLVRSKESLARYQALLEASIARELSLLRELYRLRVRLGEASGASVVALHDTPGRGGQMDK